MINLPSLLTATAGQLVSGPARARFARFGYDSRITKPGELFVALVTETGDGHDYIAEACRAGATGVLCQRTPQEPMPGISYCLVENTQQALTDYARHILVAQQVEVVAITGVVGKTSTKEAISAVLSVDRPVMSNPGNFSGRLGLPIALGLLEPEQHLAVLELADDSMGEIAHLTSITQPRVGIITALGGSHLEVFGSPEAVAQEKSALIRALPADGLAVLNGDDPLALAMAAQARCRVITVGRTPRSELWADQWAVAEQGLTLTAHWRGASHRLSIPLIGAHHLYTALAAAAVGQWYGLAWEQIATGLTAVAPLPGRTRLLPALGGARLLDDSYDATVQSALSALETLHDLPAERRIVVLGDITHLGAQSEAGLRAIGRACAGVADQLWTQGELAHLAADEARRQGMAHDAVHVAYTAGDIVEGLAPKLQDGDLVLFKGSAAARLERIVAGLLADPSSAETFLPRQHRGWQQVRLQALGRPTWVEIDLDTVAANVRAIAKLVAPAEVLAVLKADGYGHGAVKIAHTALNNGATWLGVACLGEAIALRQSGIAAPILILGYTPAWQAREAVLHDAIVTLFSLEVAQALSRAALDLDRRARVHIKVDTGMGRLGLLPDEVLPFLRQVAALPALEVDGLFTHFCSADEEDLGYTRWQLECFQAVLDALRSAGLLPPHLHAANSAAILRLPESHLNLVRLGIALYGLAPSPQTPCPAGFRPALAFKCQVAQVKELPSGAFVSYGRTFQTQRPARIAVIPVGYADGFRRGPSHWGDVLVRGRRAPIVGRVCMDQTMLDVTDIPGVRQGDEVVLIGQQGADAITVEQVAERLGTINYEVVSEILARVPRVV